MFQLLTAFMTPLKINDDPGCCVEFRVGAKARPVGGFSLVELLLVMGIIAALATFSVIGYNSIGRSRSAASAADLAASMALAARLEAMSHGLGAKLVVDNGSNPETRLQRMAIFRAEGSDPLNPSWIMAGRPMRLPEGIFFLTEAVAPGYGSTNAGQPDEVLSLPGAPNTPCIVYNFNGSGHVENPGLLFFAPGVPGTGGLPAFPAAMIDGITGFRLPANGRPAFIQSKAQAGEAKAPKTP